MIIYALHLRYKLWVLIYIETIFQIYAMKWSSLSHRLLELLKDGRDLLKDIPELQDLAGMDSLNSYLDFILKGLIKQEPGELNALTWPKEKMRFELFCNIYAIKLYNAIN